MILLADQNTVLDVYYFFLPLEVLVALSEDLVCFIAFGSIPVFNL